MPENLPDNGNMKYLISAVSIKWNTQFVLERVVNGECRLLSRKRKLVASHNKHLFFSSGHWCPVARKHNPIISMLSSLFIPRTTQTTLISLDKVERVQCVCYCSHDVLFFSLWHSDHPPKGPSRHKVDIHDALLSTRIYLKTSHLTLIINQSIAIALVKFDIFTF